MMASEQPPQYQDLVDRATVSRRLNRSGSGDALLLLTRRRVPQQRNHGSSSSTRADTNSQNSTSSSVTGNASFPSSPHAMASFFQNQAKISSKKSPHGCYRSTSPRPDRTRRSLPHHSHHGPRLGGGGATTRERNASSCSPKAMNAHASAPSLFLQQQQQPRLKPSTSGDNVSVESVNSQGSTNSVNFKGNEAMQVVQRSNGSTVKSVIARLKDIVNHHHHTTASTDQDSDLDGSISSNNSDLPTPPHQEMAMLSQWASVDAYYKVVISKYQGIPTIVKIMKLYADDPDIQVYGMTTLTHLGNKQQIHESDGVDTCIKALIRFSSNIEVQSHGFIMLKSQAMLLTQEPHDRLRPLVGLLESTKTMFLTHAGREGTVFIQRFLETYSITHMPDRKSVV